jgi:glutaredoxin
VEYFDVKQDADQLKTMLKYSDGVRKVPVIVDRDKVTIGFDGGT